jgi:hypothetical protein
MLVEFNVEFKINLHLWFPGVAERPWNENYSEDELHRRGRNRRSSQKFWLACKTDDESQPLTQNNLAQGDCCPYKRSGQRAVDRCGTDHCVDRCMLPKLRLVSNIPRLTALPNALLIGSRHRYSERSQRDDAETPF